MKVQFVASVSVIARDPDAAQRLYRGALGLSFEGGDGGYLFTERLPGVKHFGVWPLADAARSCFGTDTWPGDVVVPQGSIEFEVASAADVSTASEELRAAGLTLLHDAKEEPWGQTITRLLSDDGLIVGVCFTPWFHKQDGGGDAG
ncbi:MAG: glyoxalase [Actinomycetota bacterium]|nr:glyoxalase [Actinomycetota bacterium]